MRSLGQNSPLRRDTIFAVASIVSTKIETSLGTVTKIYNDLTTRHVLRIRSSAIVSIEFNVHLSMGTICCVLKVSYPDQRAND